MAIEAIRVSVLCFSCRLVEGLGRARGLLPPQIALEIHNSQ